MSDSLAIALALMLGQHGMAVPEVEVLQSEVARLRSALETERPVLVRNDVGAPFPYFGTKRLAAATIWAALGADIPNVVIPFAGSLSELWARPAIGKVETVNDASGLVANFWRAVQADPDAVAENADKPVIEVDLHAWHMHLVREAQGLRERLERSPFEFDAVLAGRWAWGASAWLGSGWCDPGLLTAEGAPPKRRPEISGGSGRARNGHGVHRTKLPTLGEVVHKIRAKIPYLSGGASTGVGYGRGVHKGDARREGLVGWMRALADRLRYVRVICGDFERILTPAVTTSHGLTGVILDPPYAQDMRTKNIYAHEDANAAKRAAAWARDHGDDPLLRIVLCGLEGEHNMPGWRCVAWKGHGGYGLQGTGRGRKNRDRERLWLSPGCLDLAPSEQMNLLSSLE